MAKIKLTINDRLLNVEPGKTILQAATEVDIYIPALCSHPDLPNCTVVMPDKFIYQGEKKICSEGQPSNWEGGCRLCLVQVAGESNLSFACRTKVTEGMAVKTDSPHILSERKKNLMVILSDHPHACLICAQREGCAREPCLTNATVQERCCMKFGNCELQKVVDFIGLPEDTPRFVYKNLTVLKEDPLYNRDFNLCIGCLRCVCACNDLRKCGVLGFTVQNSKVAVGLRKAPLLKDADCSFCGACVEVCPTGALTDKNKMTGATREKNLIPCSSTCPAGINVPRYVRFAALGMFDEALAVIREKIPFPAVCGFACFHPCETVCLRSEVNDAVAIMALKRFASEKGDDQFWKKSVRLFPLSGKKAAIVGAGPAGLTAAYYLARLGHAVTIFEALSQPGGMMAVGIPAYRLPRHILDREINIIKDLGVRIELNRKVDSLNRLSAEFDAVFLAMGAHRGSRLKIEGEDLPGVTDCLSYLRNVNLGTKDVKAGDRVAVIGGGNAAIDAARTAFRLGAKDVRIIYRRSKAEMPADTCEIQEAEREGVKMHFLAAPVKIELSGATLKMECICMQLGVPDAEGRARPEPIACSEFTVHFDQVIVAIGQEPDIPAEFGIDLDASGRISVAQGSLNTRKAGVFAGGDVVSGPASVIEAIAAGRLAASTMDKQMGGQGVIDEELLDYESPNAVIGKVPGFAAWPRRIDACEFDGDAQEVLAEARRCLQCDLRLQISGVKPPSEHYHEFSEENIRQAPEEAGVYQVLDKHKVVIAIRGVINIRQELELEIAKNGNANWFEWETDEMFTKRESELIQQYLQEHGKMPGGGMDELYDLF